MIQEEWPDAISEIDSDKIEIKVADLDTNSYDKFMKFIHNCLNKVDYWREEEDVDSKMKSVDWDNSKSYFDDEQIYESEEDSQ